MNKTDKQRKAESKQRYCLQLSDNSGWHITPTEESAAWVKEFARILNLSESGSQTYPKLLIERNHEPETSEEHIYMESYYMRFSRREGCPDITCHIGDEDNHNTEIYKMWNILMPVYEDVMRYGGMPFHATLLEKNGKGFLLSAPGETGKSTCARRVPAPWRALSDDECLIMKNEGGTYSVHPFPTWSDYLIRDSKAVWNVRQSLPLAGIFFLQQSETDEATPLGKGEATLRSHEAIHTVCVSRRIVEGEKNTRDRNLRIYDNIASLVNTVPMYILRVSLNGSFWEEIEGVFSDL